MAIELSTEGPEREERTPFVGRTLERRALDGAFDAVKGGETRIVTLIGPAGIGKSRLVQDLILRQRSSASGRSPDGTGTRPLRVYRGSCRGTATAFGMFARLLRARFGLSEGMDKAAAAALVQAQVAAVLDDRMVSDVVYFLSQFLGLPAEEGPLSRALGDDPQQAQIIRRAVFRAFIEADAAHSPVGIVIEDMHQAHDDTLALLRYLLEYLSGPILVFCVARPDLLARCEDWGRAGERRHRVMELGPLRDDEASELMNHLLAPCEGGVPRSLVTSACAFAAGNPLLLEQMVRIYHDKGVLHEERNSKGPPSFRVDLDKLSAVDLPLTVDDAVDARLAALDPAERAMLEQAAVMGSVFWSAAFVPLLRVGRESPDLWLLSPTDGAATTARLTELVERDYIMKLPDSSFPGSHEYVFKHNREREAIQSQTRPSAARRYHAGIADWLNYQEALRSSHDNVAMLAGHREQAGDTLLAGLAYLEAGDVARERYAVSRACDYYQKGLDLLAENFASRRIEALHHYGDVLQISGRIDDAFAAFREMLTLAYRLDLKRKGGAAHNRIGRLFRDTGALEEAGRHLHTAMALFEAEGDERGVASTIDDLGHLYWFKAEYDRALETLRDGLARRVKLNDPRSIALSLHNLGLALQDSGNFKEAIEAYEESLKLRRETGDLLGVVTTLNNLGAVARDQGNFEGAFAMFGEALVVAKQVGDRNRTALVLTNIGVVHYRTANFSDAILVLKQAEDLCDELDDKLGLAEALRGLGKAHMLQGDLLKARECVSRSVDLFASARSKVHLGIALRTLGEITAAGGWGSSHTRKAREYFTRSAAIFEQTGNDVELARTFKVYARFLLDTTPIEEEGTRRDARTMNERADAIFTRLRIKVGPVEGMNARLSRPE